MTEASPLTPPEKWQRLGSTTLSVSLVQLKRLEVEVIYTAAVSSQACLLELQSLEKLKCQVAPEECGRLLRPMSTQREGSVVISMQSSTLPLPASACADSRLQSTLNNEVSWCDWARSD